MRKNLLFLLFSAFALSLLADEPQLYSLEYLTGAKIASADAYNFEWDDETGIATINESDYAMMGKCCVLTSSSASGGDVFLSSFYGDFKIPLKINPTTGAVRIKTGKALAKINNAFDMPDGSYRLNASNSLKTGSCTYWTLYVMPVSWLMGDDELDDIHGQVNEDGTITFNDDFAFLVYMDSPNEDSWSLSPIFRNLKLLNPNGKHKFQYTRLVSSYGGPVGSGHGGLVPRNTGTSKPVTPRPFNAIIGTGACLNDNTRDIFPEGEGSTMVPKTSSEVEPVYMYMADDTTLMVYNLFGQGNRCYMYINQVDGTISLPRQQIYNDGFGDVMYNTSCTGTWSLDSIMWGKTLGGVRYPEFNLNRLLLTDGTPFDIPMEPVISYEVTDTSVIFTATAMPFNMIDVYLYMYDEETDDYIVVDNPLSVPRLDAPYSVYLAAEAFNPISEMYSDVTWYEHEVPQLGMSCLRGDANPDGEVNITDAIVLLNALLNDDWEGINRTNANVDGNESVDISDVTKLINFLLNNEWNEK